MDADHSFTAQWAKAISVTYVPGTGATVPAGASLSVSSYAGAKLTPPALTRSGYSLSWTRDGSPVTLDVNGQFEVPDVASGAVTLTAVWTAVSAAVSYSLDGGAWSGISDPSGSYSGSITLPAASQVTREGYTFTGRKQGTTVYAGGSSYAIGSSAPLTFTAQWVRNGSIAYRLAVPAGAPGYTEGVLASGAPTAADVGNSITLPMATHRSYTLTGWNDGTTTYAPGASYTVTAPATVLTAVWGPCAHYAPDARRTSVSSSYVHNSGATHTLREVTTVVCLDCGETVSTSTDETSGNCSGSVGSNWISNSTRHWHHCNVENLDFDVAAHVYVNGVCTVCGYGTRVTPGANTENNPNPNTGTNTNANTGTNTNANPNTGTNTGASDSASQPATVIENPAGGTTTIIDDEVPLAGVDNMVLVTALDPTLGIRASATRNPDGSITVNVTDSDGNTLTRVHGGVLAEIHGVTDGQVVVIIDTATGEILDLVEKSLVEAQIAYTLLDGSVTIKIVDNAKPFADVMPYDWFNSAVVFASSHELFNGVSEMEFAPNVAMTRGMLVTVLWRLENRPQDFAENVFPDVPDGTWYTEAVEWAEKNGIVTGYDDGSFQPDRNVSRQEMTAILYRYMNRLGYDMSAVGDLGRFADADQIGAWAMGSMLWANGAGIITGKDEAHIDPLGNATRAEVATMLMRIVTGMVK